VTCWQRGQFWYFLLPRLKGKSKGREAAFSRPLSYNVKWIDKKCSKHDTYDLDWIFKISIKKNGY
jgi:hypothetical protein